MLCAIDQSRFKRRMAAFIGYFIVKKYIQVLTPGNRNSSSGKGVFEDQRPANNPGHQFTHGSISISRVATGNADHRRKLAITHARKSTTTSGPGARERDDSTSNRPGGGGSEHNEAAA